MGLVGKWGHHVGGGEFHGAYDTPEGAAAGRWDSPEAGEEVLVGRYRAPVSLAESVMYDLLGHVTYHDDYAGPWADDYFAWLDPRKADLAAAVRNVVDQWSQRNGHGPEFGVVDADQRVVMRFDGAVWRPVTEKETTDG